MEKLSPGVSKLTFIHGRRFSHAEQPAFLAFLCADRWILDTKSPNVQPVALENCFYVEISTPFMIQLAFPGIVGRVSKICGCSCLEIDSSTLDCFSGP